MKCKKCGKMLNMSIYNDKGQKSCPKCSTQNGRVHVFHDQSNFGFTDKRITSKNPKGIQSYCKGCRSRSW